jgi:division/cell wall cluster transcriptional repressor MraZ
MSRKTQIGWMGVGVLLCLFSIGLTLKLREGDKAVAREDDKRAETKPPAPLPSLPDVKDVKPPEVTLGPPDVEPSPILRTGATEPMPPLPAPPPEVRFDPKPLPPDPPPVPEVKFDPKPLPPPSAPEIKPDPKPLPPPTPETPPPMPTDSKPLPPIVDPKPPVPPATPLPEPEPKKEDPKPPVVDPIPTKAEAKPDFSAPRKEVVPVSAASKPEPGEPPMVLPGGPPQTYQVRGKAETLPDIARRTLGTPERVHEIVRLNPELKPDSVLASGTTIKLPTDACIVEELDAVKPLPSLRPKNAPAKPKVLPLTGTFACNLDEHRNLTLPKAIREQLGNCETVLVSPGPDHCLWLTNHAHLERMAERIEQSPARETDVRVFKRLYYAQTEKAAVTSEGRIALTEKLAQFAGLGQELVIVGIDEHFELWDAAKWKQYTQQKSAAARAALEEE